MLPVKKVVKIDDIYCEDECKVCETMTADEMKQFQKDLRKLTNSSKMKDVSNKLNLERKTSKFKATIEKVLSQFENIKHLDEKKIQTLFIFVMQSANDLVGDLRKSDEVKDICKELLLVYVNGDENICKTIMDLSMEKVKPLTLYRKTKHLLVHGFSVFFSRMC